MKLIKKLRNTFYILELRNKKVKVLDNGQQNQILVQLWENVGRYKKGEKFLIDSFSLEKVK